jgi:hypothetical protein
MKAAMLAVVVAATPAFASAPSPPLAEPVGTHAVIATDPAPPIQPKPLAEIGAEIAFGPMHIAGVEDGFGGRLQYHLLPFAPRPGEAGAFVDIGYGYDYWRVGPGTWGMDLPALVGFGVRAGLVRMEASVGVNVISLDRVRGDTGFGLYAPLAAVTAGFDLWGITLLADARVSHQWQWGADTFDQWSFTFGFGASCTTTQQACR